jgi:hypothetical protein
METFVYDGAEVKKTGRTATKTFGTGARVKEMNLVEITPVDATFDWKKWVRPEELYVIKEKQ